MTERIPCTECGALILRATAQETGGLCMPCKGGYRKSIEAGKRRIEEEKKRRDSPPARFWRSLVDRVHRTPTGFASLTGAEQAYYAIRVLLGEVYNGGFDQYFFNGSADHYSVAVEALSEIGAMQTLALVLEAKDALFGSHDVPPTEAGRHAMLPSMIETDDDEPEWSRRLDAIEKQFCDDPDHLDERMAAFAEEHGLYESR
jgi:hypothetical protein